MESPWAIPLLNVQPSYGLLRAGANGQAGQAIA